jgi:Zn-dependent protease
MYRSRKEWRPPLRPTVGDGSSNAAVINVPSNPEQHYSDNIEYTNPAYYQSPEQQEAHPSAYQPDPYSTPDPYYYSPYAQSSAFTTPPTPPVHESPYGIPADESPVQEDLYWPQDDHSQQEQPAQKKKRKGGLAGIGAILAAIGSWLLKLKSFVLLIKFLPAAVTAIISAAVYAWIFGWPFAIGLVISLFIHEMGHALVMRLKGIPTGGLIFVPLLGAAVTMQRMPQNAKDEAEIGIAGPIAGGLAASFCLFMAQSNPHSVWAPLAYFGFFINLFNLVPIVPLDGGRVLAAIDRRLWIVGFIILIGYMIWTWLQGSFNIILLMIVVIAGFQLWSRGSNNNTLSVSQDYYNVPLRTRLLMTALYFALIAALFLGMNASLGILQHVGGLQ